MLDRTQEARFWAKVNKDGPTPAHVPNLGPCWTWIGARNDAGYGMCWIKDRPTPWQRAHRISLEIALCRPLYSGPRWVVMHLCDNRGCVNPEHLLEAKQCDNMDDMTRKGRRVHGPKPSGDDHYTRSAFVGMTSEERFWAQVEKTDTCWLWRGGRSSSGPTFRFGPGEIQRLAHRVAWELTMGPPPPTIHRTCGQGFCVNPSHLKGGPTRGLRDNSGSRNPAAKLNPRQVRRIRELAENGEPIRVLAERYNVSQASIRNIVSRKTWSQI